MYLLKVPLRYFWQVNLEKLRAFRLSSLINTVLVKKRGQRTQWVMFLAENYKNTTKCEHRI